MLASMLAAMPAFAQKDQVWTEVRSPHFVVVSNAGEKQARNVAEQFEVFRGSFADLFPSARIDLGKPLTVLAVKNERELQNLLPGYWETKGQSHPAGIFVPGEEKLYVALRTNMQGEYPFAIVYHEYAHALMRVNFRDLPLWLSEGLAEIFGNSLISSREATMGRPSSYHLILLQQNKLLPLDVLLSVDRDSPYYNEQNKTSVFYAQSWAVTHFLFLSKPGREGRLFEKYVRALAKGESPVRAAEALGDFKKFERTLENYIRQSAYYGIKSKLAEKVEKETFAARPLSPAEAAALRGDFFVHTRRPEEAKATLEEALRLDPSNALAHEAMGVLYWRQQDLASAITWFEKAAALDSRSYLAHYFTAFLGAMRGDAQSQFEAIEAHLRKAIELNKEFVPAYISLANLYLSREAKWEEALALARRAAELEPGVLSHQIMAANVLLHMEKLDEAKQLARSVAAAAKEPSDRAAAEDFFRTVERYEEERKAYEAAVREAEARAAERTAEIAAWEKRVAAEEEARRIRNENVINSSGQQGVARGTIAEVSCPGGRAINLSLTLSSSTLQFRAANRIQVAYYLTGSQVRAASRSFDPCKELTGKRAQVIYRPVKGRSYAGEVLAVELVAESATAGSAAAGDPGSITPARPRTDGTLAEGRAAAVACNGDAELVITIDFGGISLRMRAADRARVDYTVRGSPAPAGFDPCTVLRGKHVGLVYKQEDLPGDFVGSILAVDVQE